MQPLHRYWAQLSVLSQKADMGPCEVVHGGLVLEQQMPVRPPFPLGPVVGLPEVPHHASLETLDGSISQITGR